MHWNLAELAHSLSIFVRFPLSFLLFFSPRTGAQKVGPCKAPIYFNQTSHHTQKCLFSLFIWRSKDRTNFNPFPQPFSWDTNPAPFRITNPTHKYWIRFWYFYLPVPAVFRHGCYAAAGIYGGVSGYLGGGCWGSSSGVGGRVQRGDFATTFGGLFFEEPVYCVHLI